LSGMRCLKTSSRQGRSSRELSWVTKEKEQYELMMLVQKNTPLYIRRGGTP